MMHYDCLDLILMIQGLARLAVRAVRAGLELGIAGFQVRHLNNSATLPPNAFLSSQIKLYLQEVDAGAV